MSQVDGVFQLSAIAEHLIHERFTCDTRDHEDHTFCGIMFDVRCDCDLPLEYVEIQSISVRGALGPLTVWHTPDTFRGKHEDRTAWVKVYEAQHAPSRETMVDLLLPVPLRLRPGESCGLYVHSAEPGDDAIVYDNQRSRTSSYQDRCLKLLPGMAHLSNRPFGDHGFWGAPWRRNREFVGRVAYGVRWKMWNPDVHAHFPRGFRRAAEAMLMASRRRESVVYLLHDYVIHFIMNQCEWWEWPAELLQPAPSAAGRRHRVHGRACVPPRGPPGGEALLPLATSQPAVHTLPPPASSPPLRGRRSPSPEPTAQPRFAPSRKCPRIRLLPSSTAGSCAGRVGSAAQVDADLVEVPSEATSASASTDSASASTTGGRVATRVGQGAHAEHGGTLSRVAADEVRTGLAGGFCERDESADEQRRARRAEEETLTRARKEARMRCKGCGRFSCICCH